MQVTQDTVDFCKSLSKRYALLLNQFPTKENALPMYHLMADAIVWSDELPASTDSTFKRYFVVLLQMRTRAIFSSLDPLEMQILADIDLVAPDWAFCDKSRVDSKHQSAFLELQEKSRMELVEYQKRSYGTCKLENS